jgi:phosphatidylinositol 3-kinase
LKLTPFKWNQQVREWIRKNGAVKLPWDTSIECIGVVGEGILCFNSATKPWKVPLIVKKDGKEKRIDILVKFEDVRKDKLTMVMSKFIQSICQNIVDIKTYNVFPVDDNCGWIEMVEQSNTLYDVKYKFNTTLQNYIMDLNPNLTVSEMRKKFIKTSVSSCVLCYVLGVGDRHLENILVTKDGQLLHIDFSYILGDDPKNLEVEMKITEDMLNMLGGKNSSCFLEFKKYCSLAYKNIRLRSSLWYILLSYLVFSVPSIDNYKHTYRTIENHVIERLLPGETDNEASMQIIDIVERSSTNNWKQNLADFSHKISNTLKDFTQFNMDL